MVGIGPDIGCGISMLLPVRQLLCCGQGTVSTNNLPFSLSVDCFMDLHNLQESIPTLVVQVTEPGMGGGNTLIVVGLLLTELVRPLAEADVHAGDLPQEVLVVLT